MNANTPPRPPPPPPPRSLTGRPTTADFGAHSGKLYALAMALWAALIIYASYSAWSWVIKEMAHAEPELVTVEELFTHNGVTVYRFHDGDRVVYFTNRAGSTAAVSPDGSVILNKGI